MEEVILVVHLHHRVHQAVVVAEVVVEDNILLKDIVMKNIYRIIVFGTFLLGIGGMLNAQTTIYDANRLMGSDLKQDGALCWHGWGDGSSRW